VTDGSSDPKSRPEGLRDQLDLFVASVLLLFLELACIRWFPAHVPHLSFFTNTVLLATFLGMSIGCLVAKSRFDWLLSTPILLAVAFCAALFVESERGGLFQRISIGDQRNPEEVFFGAEPWVWGKGATVPMELLLAVFFVAIALVMVGPGQELGRALARVPGRVRAYSINVAGSIAGIALFGLLAKLWVPPVGWFLISALLVAWLALSRSLGSPALRVLALLPLVAAVWFSTLGPRAPGLDLQTYWSPYYRVDYSPKSGGVMVNLQGHQVMRNRESPDAQSYALPHALESHSGGPPFGDVLVIGAGTGNDLSRALQWGAKHVDAVEIDPVIATIARDHPNKPYEDPRVELHLDDGRSFLRTTDRQYDLIVFALVDSLILHSSYSNIRLESYLFTREAFEDARRRLKPGGVFVLYNYYRQGWIVDRIQQQLASTFGAPPIVFTFPRVDEVSADTNGGYFAMILSGAIGPMREALARSAYLAPRDVPLRPDGANGFQAQTRGAWGEVRESRVVVPPDLEEATDDWPFLYVRSRKIPAQTWRGMGLVAAIAALMLVPQIKRSGGTLDMRMFFLGAGFMLVETKAVVHMALLFGSTWMVNSVVFLAILVMILAANGAVAALRPTKLAAVWALLGASLIANAIVPLDAFLGLPPLARTVASCLLVFAPIFFAGIAFAASFARSTRPDADMGANVAGAMLGGLAENASMLIGFRGLVLIALGCYALAALARGPGARADSG
jgi:spermidine synthase